MLCLFVIRRVVANIVVARLPFEPYSMVTSMTHSGLEGEDMQEVGLFFVYTTTMMALRGVVSKVLGSQEGPRLPVDYQVPKWLKDVQKKYD